MIVFIFYLFFVSSVMPYLHNVYPVFFSWSVSFNMSLLTALEWRRQNMAIKHTSHTILTAHSTTFGSKMKFQNLFYQYRVYVWRAS